MKLRLTAEPNRRLRPDLARCIGGIEASLRQEIRAVVSGAQPWPIFLNGPAGTGKTCAAFVILDHCESEGLYYTASEWVELATNVDRGKVTWRAEGGSIDVTPTMLRSRVERAALVVLDELATRDRVADWHYEKIKNLLDWRERRPLVVISNLDLTSVERIYDDRIASRLAAGTILAVTGSDRRVFAGPNGSKTA